MMLKLQRQIRHTTRVAFWTRLLLIVLLVVMIGTQCADACPGCKNALSENDPQHAQMVRGYFWSILFMMAMPFAIAGTFGTFFYLEIRRKRSTEQAEDSLG
ncbi:MAG: hypothetical protein OSA43_00080 [Pirellulales bacterium]|nr:hypothetical protein [Pirellulales bacterium]